MKVAVLMSGQARHLEQSADWWTKRTFQPAFERLHADYFFNIWDDGTDNLDDRIKNLYNARVVEISDYDATVKEHIRKIKEGNETANDWHLVPDYAQHTVCYKQDDISSYMYNFPGMFLACSKIAKTFEPYHSEYDIAIKTRTDCLLNDLSEYHWQRLLGNMLRQRHFNDIIFTPWMSVKGGLPFIGDLCFIGKPHLMQNFMRNIDQDLLKIATHDKHLLSDFLLAPDIPFAHWIWSRLSLYSRTNWLAISVVWPAPFGTCLLRNNEPVLDKTYQHLEHVYNTEEARRHEQLYSYA
tara:strand:- start:1394 stop:2281 length:888 start_codon:yes stop_codon:yes gene_type:complete